MSQPNGEYLIEKIPGSNFNPFAKFDVTKMEEIINEMHANGYELVTVYPDLVSMPCMVCKEPDTILIFKKIPP